MNIVATDVTIEVGEHKVLCDIAINDSGNIEILWKDDIHALCPDGFCTEGYNNEIILYPFNP